MIIHFTKDIKSLLSILKDKGLRLKYCDEEFSNNKGKISSHAAHPMVSFSEYDENALEEKKLHMETVVLHSVMNGSQKNRSTQ